MIPNTSIMTAAQSILVGTKEYAPIERLDMDENETCLSNYEKEVFKIG